MAGLPNRIVKVVWFLDVSVHCLPKLSVHIPFSIVYSYAMLD